MTSKERIFNELLKILKLKNHKNKEITLTKLEQITGQDRKNIAQTLARIVKSRRESVYQTQDLYEAMKNKLEGGVNEKKR